MPCRPRLGNEYTLNVHFRPSHGARRPRVKFALVFDFGHPSVDFLEREDSGACQYLNVTCPIEAGQYVSYNHTFTLPRKDVYSTVPVKIEWQLYDPSQRQKLACVRVPVHMIY
nr:Sy-MD2-type-Int13C [Parasacculina yatsui]